VGDYVSCCELVVVIVELIAGLKLWQRRWRKEIDDDCDEMDMR
jgi:hypothetical protein